MHVQDGKPANLQYGEGLAKIHLVSRDGNRLVGIGPDVLSAHMLRPYQDPSNPEHGGWEEFEPRIGAGLEAYQKVVETSVVNRVGLRCINKIKIPLASARVAEYLKCTHLEVENLPKRFSISVSRIEYLYDDEIRPILSCGIHSTSSDSVECLLDLDVIWQNETAIEWTKSLEIASGLHERAGSAFEAVVTDRARELFKVV